ncbi:hypothetical protein AB0O04_33975 [Streptomyces althioticus]|uniref:hypothetical protein n=1 Tax=Streptomyces althioticus TaxID=83380 RepID=UPI00343E0415
MSGPIPPWRPWTVCAPVARWTRDQPLTVLSPESWRGKRATRFETQVAWKIAPVPQ